MSDILVKYYNILEQTEYFTKVSPATRIENVSDNFLTEQELNDLAGTNSIYWAVSSSYSFTNHGVVANKLLALGNKLEKSGRQTIEINDDDLLNFLTGEDAKSVPHYTNNRFARRGSNLYYYKPPKPRKKKKKTRATYTDIQNLWWWIDKAALRKYGQMLPYAKVRYRTWKLMTMYKKIFSWKDIAASATDAKKGDLPLLKHVWDNPKEYLSE